MAKPKRIFIIGHIGAGKALLAKALAEKLAWSFVDADLGLERQVGRTLDEIIGKQGEEAFHQCETEILSHYLGRENIVVTTGASIIATEKNRKLLSSEYVVYVKVNTSEQIKRMSNTEFLLPTTDPKTFLDKMHLERDSLFEKIATQTIDSISIEDDVDKIIKALEK